MRFSDDYLGLRRDDVAKVLQLFLVYGFEEESQRLPLVNSTKKTTGRGIIYFIKQLGKMISQIPDLYFLPPKKMRRRKTHKCVIN